MTSPNPQLVSRARKALQAAFVADALAMPVHWYYRPLDIQRQFPGGINRFYAAPEKHPSSIMNLHSTSAGGRSGKGAGAQQEIVGDVILKGKRKFWGVPNMHYHQGLRAGENTLNAHCARLLIRTLVENQGRYDRDRFLDAYVEFMTASSPQHPDSYAESYHRGFFANWAAGKPAHQCGAVTHDTASIGGLVMIAPIVFSELLRGIELDQITEHCRQHLALTHPDEDLAKICTLYVELLHALLFRDQGGAEALIERNAKDGIGLNLETFMQKELGDNEVVGGLFSPACYISGAWPAVLYFARKYLATPDTALQANAEVGGDNVHRGFVLATLLGAANDDWQASLFEQLVDSSEIEQEIDGLIKV